jgi:pyruvate dehydrogenase E1 component alpha subunit
MTAPDRDTLVHLYQTMTLIKQCDERFRTMLASGQLAIMYYPPRGQEAIAAAIGATLRRDDYLVTTYRGLHDHLAKGASLRALVAEYLGRATGTCKGKGGPMHITDKEAGVMVTTGIVGSGLPIANGLAFASQVAGDGKVTVVTFGDGASNIGAFHEALNLAAVWSLPVVFVCQNNGYGESTAFSKAARQENVAVRAAAYGMPGVCVDGNDPLAIYDAMDSAVGRARSGEGPTLVEARTYRFWGHYFGDMMGYMPSEERAAAMEADPVPRYRAWLIEQGHVTDEQLAGFEASVEAEISDAIDFARNSAPPDPDELLVDVYGEVVPA